jgi:hypothetical protein
VKERLDNRVLGAVRWVDAVSLAPIPLPLVASGKQLRFTRNLSGLTVVTHADGLEVYENTFNLDDLAPADRLTTGSVVREAQVFDPSGTYLPTKFTLPLPRNPSPEVTGPDDDRPADSWFTPVDVALLPSPKARAAAGWAQVRVSILDAGGEPMRNVLARIVATADNGVLGCGLSDDRGEAVVFVPSLKLFAAGATEEDVVTVVTEARLEIVPPTDEADVIDWSPLLAKAAKPADVDPTVLQLRAGRTYSRRYPFPP